MGVLSMEEYDFTKYEDKIEKKEELKSIRIHICPNCGMQMINQGGRDCYVCMQCNWSEGHCSV